MKAEKLAFTVATFVPLVLAAPGYAAGGEATVVPVRQGTAAQHAAHNETSDAGKLGKGQSAAWAAFPTLKIRISGESRERRSITIVPQGMVADRVEAYSSDLADAQAHHQLPFDMAGAKLSGLKTGGFHWLAAREEEDGNVRVASTVYYSSAQGGQNPTALFMRQKHELEIIPQPYPREHSRYRANESWKFLVRFNGKPLAGSKVFMETANGSKAELISDAHGMVTLVVPDDFKEARSKPGEHDHGRRGAGFVLATEHVEVGKSYLTAFNASYGQDAFDQRSLALGLGFTLLGMAGAVPLLRQRKNTKRGGGIKEAIAEANNKDA